MGQQAIAGMTADEFLAWQETQDNLYELVDGFPLRMMSGAGNRHDQVTINLIVAVDRKLDGKTCRPTTQDTSIQISRTQIRRADMAIACGPILENCYIANDPRAVFEVLSPSTRLLDGARKLEEYKSLASITHILLIDPDQPELIHFMRDSQENWRSRTVLGLDGVVAFEDLGFTLAMTEIYRSLTFRPKPLLVMPDEAV